MASFFGEVTALSSRAVDDEEEQHQPNYDLWIEMTEQFVKINSKWKLIMFAVGDIAFAFVQSHLLPDNSPLLSVVKCLCERSEDDTILYTSGSNLSSTVKVASVYAASDEILICEVSSAVPEEISFDLCDMLLKKFPASEAVVLATFHVATYKAHTPMIREAPLLRALATSKYMEKYSCKISRLEPPNFVSSFPAAVLSHFEVTKSAALCVVNYVDTYAVDSLNIEVFEKVLNETATRYIPINSDAKSRLVEFVKMKQSNEQNLYT